MISNIFDKNIVKIVSFFVISPGSRYSRKEIKEKTEMNNIPLDVTIKKLGALKILKEEKHLYSLNFESEQAKIITDIIKNEYNRLNLTHKIFNILFEASEKIARIGNVEALILFGSYAKLIHTEKSDIDFAIIIKQKTKNRGKLEAAIKKEIGKISKKSGKEIHTHFFTQKEIKENKNDPIIKDIIKNGKRLL